MCTDTHHQHHKMYKKLTGISLCTSILLLCSPAFALLNNGTPSKVAVPLTAAINTSLTQIQAPQNPIQESNVTELLFEVERISREPQTPAVETMTASPAAIIETNETLFTVDITEVTYASIPNENRRPTPSKTAVATQVPPPFVPPVVPPAIQEQPNERQEEILLATPSHTVYTIEPAGTPAGNPDIEEITLPLTTALTAETQPQPNLRRRPTPSKIAVNATVIAPAPAPEIPPRNASTHFYLSAPSKTPVAALEAISTRSSQLPLNLNARSVLVIDQNSREILYSKNPLDTMPIASITKLMTAMIVLEAKQNLNQIITITAADVDTLKSTSSRLYVGAKLTRRDLLHLTLMSSENRAAHALSRNYPGGKKAFIAAMNEKARQLGMTQTYYADPTGLSNQNRSSATDLVWLVDAAYKYDLIRNLSTSNKHRVTAGNTRLNYTSSNNLIRERNWTIGLQKTGYIREAGYCLVMQTQISGKSLIMVLLDADAKNNRTNDVNNIRRWIST